MDISLLALFVWTELLFSISPGPAVVIVVSSAIVGGYRLAFSAILGVLAGNLIYFTASAALITSSVNINSDYFFYIKLAGAAYLTHILYREYISPYVSKKNGMSSAATEQSNVCTRNLSGRFYTTLAMQLSNPKAIIFFAAFLPQFVNHDISIPIQFATLAFLSIATEFFVLLAYAASGQAMVKRGSERFGIYAHHAGNILMAAAVIWSLLR